MTLKINAKCGDNGKLFGAITAKDITENLKKEFNIIIDKKKIIIDESIKQLGGFNINIKLYEGVIANLKVLIQEQ